MLNTQRLRPTSHKSKCVHLEILESGCVRLTFQSTGEIIEISSDGSNILSVQSNVYHSFDDVSKNVKLRKKYEVAKKFVDLIKSKTPKITFYADKAKCYWMENGDFQSVFYDDAVKINYNSVKDEISINDRLIPSSYNECSETNLHLTYFHRYREHCFKINEAVLNIDPSEKSFPMTLGQRKPVKNPSMITSSVQLKSGLSVRNSNLPQFNSLQRSSAQTIISKLNISTLKDGRKRIDFDNDGTSLVIENEGVNYLKGGSWQFFKKAEIPSEIQAKLKAVQNHGNQLKTSKYSNIGSGSIISYRT